MGPDQTGKKQKTLIRFEFSGLITKNHGDSDRMSTTFFEKWG